jgi:hypothetical protein
MIKSLEHDPDRRGHVSAKCKPLSEEIKLDQEGWIVMRFLSRHITI